MSGQSKEYQSILDANGEYAIGSKSQWMPSFPARAKDYALLGATNQVIADMLGVDISCVEEWIRAKPPFRRAIMEGRQGADVRVVRALYRRAVGGVKVKKQKAMSIDGTAQVIDIIEELPPDVNAARYWLNNRQPLMWRDRTGNESAQTTINLLQIVEDSLGSRTIDAKAIESVQDQGVRASIVGPGPGQDMPDLATISGVSDDGADEG